MLTSRYAHGYATKQRSNFCAVVSLEPWGFGTGGADPVQLGEPGPRGHLRRRSPRRLADAFFHAGLRLAPRELLGALPRGWEGGTKLIALYGSRTDNQWSDLGKAGTCPNGTDFFAAMIITEAGGGPGPTRLYPYYPAMAREPEGVTCWGRYGDGSEPCQGRAMPA